MVRGKVVVEKEGMEKGGTCMLSLCRRISLPKTTN